MGTHQWSSIKNIRDRQDIWSNVHVVLIQDIILFGDLLSNCGINEKMVDIKPILRSKFISIKKIIPVKYGVSVMCSHGNDFEKVLLKNIGDLTSDTGDIKRIISGQCLCRKVFYRVE